MIGALLDFSSYRRLQCGQIRSFASVHSRVASNFSDEQFTQKRLSRAHACVTTRACWEGLLYPCANSAGNASFIGEIRSPMNYCINWISLERFPSRTGRHALSRVSCRSASLPMLPANSRPPSCEPPHRAPHGRTKGIRTCIRGRFFRFQFAARRQCDVIH